MSRIPCLTVWQPWATLIVLGAKPFEFRGHVAPRSHQGKRIGIHAGARPAKRAELADLIQRLKGKTPWSTALRKDIALPILERAYTTPGILPLSQMLGTAVLGVPRPGWEVAPDFGGVINDSDRAEHCNYAWPLTEIEAFEPPIAAKGAQGFWYWTAPSDALATVD